MYLLFKYQPRAEITDTLLYAVSNSHAALEEYLLSMYDALVDREIEWAKSECNLTDETIDIDNLRKWCIERLRSFDIVWVPYFED